MGIAVLGSVSAVLAILLGFALVRGHEPGWRHVPYEGEATGHRGWAAGACPCWGMVGGTPGGMGRMQSMMSPVAMDVADGILYVATADALARMEAKDLKVARSVEIPAAGRGMPLHGPVVVRVAEGSVYVSRGDRVYRFNAETLALEAKRELPLGTHAEPRAEGRE